MQGEATGALVQFGEGLGLQLESRLSAGGHETWITCRKLGHCQAFIWFLTKKLWIGETFLSSVLTCTSLEICFGICWFLLFEHWLYSIEITTLRCASSIQKAIIVTAKSKTSAWGKILLVRAMKMLLWGKALMVIPLFCYVAQFTSSDCASIWLFFYIPMSCWMKKASGAEKVWKNYCQLPQIR